MAKATSGGQSKAALYAVKLDTATDTYKFHAIPAGTVVAAPTDADAYELDEILKTPPSHTEDGTVDVAFEQMDSGPDMDAFLDLVAVPAGSSGGLEPYKLENGVEKGGTSGSSGYQILMISYLQKDEDSGKIKVLIALGSLAATSGSYETNPEDYNKVAINFVGSKAEANFSIPADLFDSTIVDTTSAATQIDKGKGFVRSWLAEAA